MFKEKGYVTLTVALLVCLLGAFYILAPKKSEPDTQTTVIEKCIPTAAGGEVIPYSGGSYKQIRAQVQIESKLFKDRRYSNLVESNHNKDRRVFDVYSPTNLGKTVNRLRNPQFSQTENQPTDRFYLVDSGLIFFVHKEASDLQPKTLTVGGIEFWKTDVYQDTGRLNSKPVPPEIFYCPDSRIGSIATPTPAPQVKVYPQPSQAGEQVQLRFFDFTNNPGFLNDPTLALIE